MQSSGAGVEQRGSNPELFLQARPALARSEEGLQDTELTFAERSDRPAEDLARRKQLGGRDLARHDFGDTGAQRFVSEELSENKSVERVVVVCCAAAARKLEEFERVDVALSPITLES